MKKRLSVSKAMGVILCSLVLGLLSVYTANAWEPTKPVEFVVPAGSGGGAD